MELYSMQDGKYQPRFGFPIASWHKWFAWHPVYTVDRGWRWLRFVYKRPIQLYDYIYNYGYSDVWWQYAVDKN